jgi:hypothetical protein
MGWEIVLFLIALACGLKFGAKAVWSGVKNRHEANVERRAHKARLVEEAINSGMAPRQAKAAAVAATRTAVTVSGWVAAWLAWKNGWREGWEKGRKRGTELRDGTTIHHGDDEQRQILEDVHREDDSDRNTLLDLPNQAAHCSVHMEITEAEYRNLADRQLCTREVAHKDCAAGWHQIPTFCGQLVKAERTRLCDEHRMHTRPEPQTEDRVDPCTSQSPTKKEPENMAIETGAVSGEILTKQQFESAMKAIISEETAEIEDANGDLKRAEEHSKQVELMAASLESAQIDPATVTAVKQFLDGSSTRMSDAQQRVANADLRKTTAENALTTLQASRQNQFYSA